MKTEALQVRKKSVKVRGIRPLPTFGDCAHQAIQKHFKKSVKYTADVLRDLDPEPLHQMRVGMRRLRTALQVFAPAIATPIENRKISKIAKELGRVRDLDVLYIWFQQYLRQASLTPAEALELQLLLQRLQTRRGAQFDQMQNLLESKQYRTFVSTLKKWLRHPQYTPLAQLPIQSVLPDLLLPLISELLLHPAWMVAVATREGAVVPQEISDLSALNQDFHRWEPLLHDLRKQMKGVRYQTEFFMDFYGQSFRQQTREFRLIQDQLGHLQDQMVLDQFLSQGLGTDWAQKIPSLAQYFQQERWRLWQQWQAHQRQYLDSGFRKELRSQLLNFKS
ncbi:MAG: CHAD domain-containing protein [Cyanobacteria bacterium P01_A01_bin.17]